MVRESFLIAIISVVSSAILAPMEVHATNKCAELLSSSSKDRAKGKEPLATGPQKNGTEGLIAYLGTLLEHQIIGDKELLRLIESLEKGEISNPIHEEETWISSAALIHREEIQEYINKTTLSREKLLDFAKRSLKEKERVRVKREEAREETQDIYQKIELHPVREGRFQMGEGQNKRTVNLTHPIEVMSTQVTQKQWVEVMGENPSKFQEGEHTIVVNLNGKAVKMQPDNPVEQVTWWSVVVFANKLSEKYGFKPAYDLSGIKWKAGTRAEDGTLEAESGEVKIIAGGETHDPESSDIYYQAEGFRLPTEAEQEYMLRALGAANGEYHFGDSEADLKDHAWFSENSGSRTHPVGLLRPLTVDGKDFYDLHGNVWEWGFDWYASDLKGGDNPVGAKSGSGRVLRGGGCCNSASFLRSADRNGVSPGYRRNFDVGFRLVRTAK